MNYGSVCSGIEAATVAWHSLGWKASWFAEIEPFPSAVLAQRYPTVSNLGDMTKISARIAVGEIDAPDVLVGGTPCQAFSVAGLRGGLSDARGQLTLSYVELANAIDTARIIRGERPAIIVWENVPGVLSTKDNAFGCFLGALAGEDCELEPPGRRWSDAGSVFGPQRAIAWRVLDAQYFGVAQRRRRVFVVASARDGFDPSEVLFEFGAERKDQPPMRNDDSQCNAVAIRTRGDAPVIERGGDLAFALRASQGGSDKLFVEISGNIRRATEAECERLQGFPNNYTLVEVNGKPAADGPRYKALGNSMAVPCMRWIGERIETLMASISRECVVTPQ